MGVHGGTQPVPVGPYDYDVGSVEVGDQGDDMCVWLTVAETGETTEITCVDRGFLVGLDGFVPKEEVPIGFHEDPEDVPGSGPIFVPGTPPIETPDVPDVPPIFLPATPPIGTPDVPVLVPEDSVQVPEYSVIVDISYRYDEDHLEDVVRLAGQDIWAPVNDPLDALWYAENGEDVPLIIAVEVLKDGEHYEDITLEMPYLGQALAAAEMTGGTM